MVRVTCSLLSDRRQMGSILSLSLIEALIKLKYKISSDIIFGIITLIVGTIFTILDRRREKNKRPIGFGR